jgi:hypothetical protein
MPLSIKIKSSKIFTLKLATMTIFIKFQPFCRFNFAINKQNKTKSLKYSIGIEIEDWQCVNEKIINKTLKQIKPCQH